MPTSLPAGTPTLSWAGKVTPGRAFIHRHTRANSCSPGGHESCQSPTNQLFLTNGRFSGHANNKSCIYNTLQSSWFLQTITWTEAVHSDRRGDAQQEGGKIHTCASILQHVWGLGLQKFRESGDIDPSSIIHENVPAETTVLAVYVMHQRKHGPHVMVREHNGDPSPPCSQNAQLSPTVDGTFRVSQYHYQE